MEVTIYSIPKSEEEKSKWPSNDEICPRCQQPFGHWKKQRLPSGEIIHKSCAKKEERI